MICVEYHPSTKEQAGNTGILTVLSKTRGWLTVTPTKADRKCPIDRKQPVQKQRDPSMMAPLWIHEQVASTSRNDHYMRNLGQRLNRTDDLQAETAKGSLVLSEHKRMFLREKLEH